MSSPGSHKHPSRRDLIALGIGAFAIAAIPFASRRRQLVRRSLPVMGTIGEIGVVHPDSSYANAAIDAAFGELRRIERLMTRFTDTSEIGRVNASGGRPAVVSDDTATVLRTALLWAEASDGRFDPCLGRSTELWDIAHRHEPPGPSSYHRYAGRRLYRALDLDGRAGASMVQIGDPDAAIDLGGIAKGYGVDRAVATLRDWAITDGLVNVGGDLYAMGESADGDPWRVGIRSPMDPWTLIGDLPLEDAAVATSGDYLQYFEHHGHRYHHLMDPGTGAPRATGVHSITVTGTTCMDADAAATAAFGMERDGAVQLLRRSGRNVELARII